MSGSGEQKGPFKVSRSNRVWANIRRLQGVTLRFGSIDAYERAIREIDKALISRADSFGEEKYQLPQAQLDMRLAVIRPVAVFYGVYRPLSLVFVSWYRLLALPGL
jgi:hypothetical protein